MIEVMEMHQVRYFLAAAQLLNFTKAAEACNVAQPSLTRAIKQLEAELGGDLFRRERPHAQLTELGQRMLPLLNQCYQSASSARTLAKSLQKGDGGTLKLALSLTIDILLLIPCLTELTRAFRGLEIKILRGDGKQISDILRNGDAEFAVASTLDDDWDRIDRWPLFDEDYSLGVNNTHKLAGRTVIASEELQHEQFLIRNYCENTERFMAALQSHNLAVANHRHEVSSERDLTALVEANIGIAMVPSSALIPETLVRIPITGIDLSRTVYLYGVAGRQRTMVGTALMNMLRAANWSSAAA